MTRNRVEGARQRERVSEGGGPGVREGGGQRVSKDDEGGDQE